MRGELKCSSGGLGAANFGGDKCIPLSKKQDLNPRLRKKNAPYLAEQLNIAIRERRSLSLRMLLRAASRAGAARV